MVSSYTWASLERLEQTRPIFMIACPKDIRNIEKQHLLYARVNISKLTSVRSTQCTMGQIAYRIWPIAQGPYTIIFTLWRDSVVQSANCINGPSAWLYDHDVNSARWATSNEDCLLSSAVIYISMSVHASIQAHHRCIHVCSLKLPITWRTFSKYTS